MKPLHYNIHLEPDLNTFKSAGTTQIELKVDSSSANLKNLSLHSVNLQITECFLNNIKAKFELKPKLEELHIELSDEIRNQIELSPEKKIELTINHIGEINETLLGFYRSHYFVDGEKRYIAVTQFEEREARKAFPCFDHPSKKATFHIEMLIDEKLSAISNTGIISEEKVKNHKKLVKFERTPKMCTYQLFFGVGEFEFLENYQNGILIRLITPPGQTQYGKKGLEYARKSLEFGERYTGIKYPISKYDVISVADFAYGAMENYGAVTFRENLLLVYPDRTPLSEQARIMSIVAHETAHMWFGNLVSPLDWQYIWLNESFASYFTYLIPDHYFPEWNFWNKFILEQTLPGFERDSYRKSHPIELIAEEGEINIDSSSAPIIYNKGASFLSMLVDYLGEEKFKAGCNYFLDKYKYECANSDQYWEAFEEATSEPIKLFADKWVHQIGFPKIQVIREKNQIYLKQNRFTYITNDSEAIWHIPIKIGCYNKENELSIIQSLMTESSMAIDLPPNTQVFKLNFGQKGFFRVNYDLKALNNIKALIKQGGFPAIDRFGIENDYFAQLLQGEYNFEEYLDFIESTFSEELEFLPIMDILSNLSKLCLIIPQKLNNIQEFGKKLVNYGINAIGFNPSENETLEINEIRNALFIFGLDIKAEQINEYLIHEFEKLLQNQPVNPNILFATLKAGALYNTKAKKYMLQQLTTPSTPESVKLKNLQALAYLSSEKEILECLEFNFENVPVNNRYILLVALANNIKFQSKLWFWIKSHFNKIETLHPHHLGRILVDAIPMGAIGKYEEVQEFLNAHISHEGIDNNLIQMGLERLEIFTRLRNRN